MSSVANNKQVWVGIPEWSGLYEATEQGDIRSVVRVLTRTHPKNPHRTQTRAYGGRVLAQKTNRNGYREVSLWANNTIRTLRVHRLIAATFLPPPINVTMDVNHKNGDRSDNRVCNLEWVTRSENHLHAYRVLGRTTVAGKPCAQYVGKEQ